MANLQRKNFSPLVLLIFLSIIFQKVHGEKPCALLLGGFKTTCRVIRAVNPPELLNAQEMMELHPGDIIIQESDINNINVKLLPFASKKEFACGGGFRIDYTPPEKKTIFEKLAAYLVPKKEIYVMDKIGTRDLENKEIRFKPIFPQPGYWVTVLPKDTIVFSWDERFNGVLIFYSEDGKDVLRKEFKLNNSIKLTPEEINMIPAKTYRWGIQANGIKEITTCHYLQLLNDKILKTIQADLDDIGKSEKEDIEKELIKATYFQFISDKYEGKVDLYWKSYQCLETISQHTLRFEDRQTHIILYENYKQHFTNQERKAFMQ